MSGLSLRVKQALFRVSPDLAWRLAALRSPETAFGLKLARALADPQRIGIDIGGSWGLFAAALQSRVAALHVIEPNPEKAAFLRATLSAGSTIHAIALSDQAGEVDLHIPEASSALATIEAGNAVRHMPGRSVSVRRERLDALGLGPVGFIKMDVEGHEAAALAGAEELLLRDHPALLIEIEERHRPGGVHATIDWLEARGYHAFMPDGQRLRDAHEFSPAADQPEFGPDGRRPARYVNDFVFLATEKAEGQGAAQRRRLAAAGIALPSA